jgi:hypothetical protein
MTFYILKDGTKTGPYTVTEVAEAIRQGRLSMSNQAWHEGMTSWEEICKIPSLVDATLPPLPKVDSEMQSLPIPTDNPAAYPSITNREPCCASSTLKNEKTNKIYLPLFFVINLALYGLLIILGLLQFPKDFGFECCIRLGCLYISGYYFWKYRNVFAIELPERQQFVFFAIASFLAWYSLEMLNEWYWYTGRYNTLTLYQVAVLVFAGLYALNRVQLSSEDKIRIYNIFLVLCGLTLAGWATIAVLCESTTSPSYVSLPQVLWLGVKGVFNVLGILIMGALHVKPA